MCWDGRALFCPPGGPHTLPATLQTQPILFLSLLPASVSSEWLSGKKPIAVCYHHSRTPIPPQTLIHSNQQPLWLALGARWAWGKPEVRWLAPFSSVMQQETRKYYLEQPATCRCLAISFPRRLWTGWDVLARNDLWRVCTETRTRSGWYLDIPFRCV